MNNPEIAERVFDGPVNANIYNILSQIEGQLTDAGKREPLMRVTRYRVRVEALEWEWHSLPLGEKGWKPYERRPGL